MMKCVYAFLSVNKNPRYYSFNIHYAKGAVTVMVLFAYDICLIGMLLIGMQHLSSGVSF